MSMDTEKQKYFIIHVLYYTLLLILCYIFLRYIIYMIMPFILGFAIANALHPLIHRLSRHGHERLYSLLVIMIFYILLTIILAWLMIQGFFYVKEWMTTLPSFYETYIEPYLNTSATSVASGFKSIDIPTAELLSSVIKSLQDSLSSLVSSVSHTILSSLGNIMASLPSILLSFFFTILSSFFINADYNRITNSWLQHLPMRIQTLVSEVRHFLKTTMKQLFYAYARLMILTFIELIIGLYLLGVEHIFWISAGIALFDIIPILGCGGILLPWAMIVYLNQQPKLAIGLLIVYLIITLIRNIIEPRIIGHQIGLHPLLMLLSMYIGAKLFKVLGIFTLPITILIIKELYVQNHKLAV